MRALLLAALFALSLAACTPPGQPPAANQSPSPAADQRAGATASEALTAGAVASPTAQATAATLTPPVVATPIVVTSVPTALAALDTHFQGPQGLALDAVGNLYVTQCEWTWATIDKVDPNGVVTRFAGTGKPGFSGDGGPATDAQLYCPAGIAVGTDGAVYFADHVNNRVRRVDAAGVISTFAGSGAAGLDQGSFSGDGGPATLATLQEPWGVAFDHAGRLYIADRDNRRVRRVDTNGDISTVAGNGVEGATGDGGPATEATICAPVGIAISPDGDIILPNNCTRPMRKVTDGIITTVAGTGSAHGIPAFDSEGNAIFDLTGSMLVQAGVWIVRIDASGDVTTVAGNGTDGAPIDGARAVDSPLPGGMWGLAVDRVGNIYVADGTASVWRIDTKGVLRLFAGKPA